MSTARNTASAVALASSRNAQKELYGIALPALRERQGAVNAALARGEPEYMRSAFEGQRGAITEGLTAQGGVASAQQMAGGKAALSGGNPYSQMHPADIGAQLANALYGSKFAEGQSNIDQTFNLMNMALGGAGATGSGALQAGGQQLGAINFLPNYNQTYANVAGGLAGGASIYGMLNKYGLFDSPYAKAGSWGPSQYAAYGNPIVTSGNASWLGGEE